MLKRRFLETILINQKLLQLIIGLKVACESLGSFFFNSVAGNVQALELDAAVFAKSIGHHLSSFGPKSAIQQVQMGE